MKKKKKATQNSPILIHQTKHKYILIFVRKAFPRRGFSFLVPRRSLPHSSMLPSQSYISPVFPTLPASTFLVIPTQPLFPPRNIQPVRQGNCGEPQQMEKAVRRHQETQSTRRRRATVNESTGFLYGVRGNSSLSHAKLYGFKAFPKADDFFFPFCDTFMYSVQSHMHIETRFWDNHSALFPTVIHKKCLRPVKTKGSPPFQQV